MSCDCYRVTGLTLFEGQFMQGRVFVSVSHLTEHFSPSPRRSTFHIETRKMMSLLTHHTLKDFQSLLFVPLFQKIQPDQQWIHHDWRIQLPWPPLSLPIWWPAEDWWAEHSGVREDAFFAPPPWRLKCAYDLQAAICPLIFCRSPCWMMVWKMKSEAWYLNINFPDGHASPTGYLSPVFFFLRFDLHLAHISQVCCL